MTILRRVENWIATSNTYDVSRYVEFFNNDAVLDDPSVGKKFVGHTGIKEYFHTYFVGYRTQTKLLKLESRDTAHAYLEVEFTGTFPEGRILGTFDLTFDHHKIQFIKADLLPLAI